VRSPNSSNSTNANAASTASLVILFIPYYIRVPLDAEEIFSFLFGTVPVMTVD
jgi:hypothetical protein